MHRETSLSFCVSIVSHALATSETVRSAEYKNTACVENVFVQSFSFTIR